MNNYLTILICLNVIAVIVFLVYFKKYKKEYEFALHEKDETLEFLNTFSSSLIMSEHEDVSQQKNRDSIMSSAAKFLAESLCAEAAGIYVFEKGFFSLVGVHGQFPPLNPVSINSTVIKRRFTGDSLFGSKIKENEGILSEVLKHEILCINNIDTNEALLNIKQNIMPLENFIAKPLIDEQTGKVKGVICAINSVYGSFSQLEMDRIVELNSQILFAKNFLNLYSSIKKQERLDQELIFTRNLQLSLLPKEIPKWGEFIIEAKSQPSKEVSGDLYDFIEIDEDRLLVFIADACGKGVGACMMVSMMRSYMQANISRFTTLKEMLKELNENMFRDTESGQFVTLTCCLLDKKNDTIEFARAGHTELLVYVREHIRALEPNGDAIGLLPDELSSVDNICFTLSQNMNILLFTDGVTEAINTNNEQYSMENLKEIFKAGCLRGKHPKELSDDIFNSIENFTEGVEEIFDDQTIVIIKHL